MPIVRPKIPRFIRDVVVGAALFQLVLILYKHYVGYAVLSGPGNFFITWLFATLLTSPTLAAIILLDLWGMARLDARFPWTDTFWKRLFSEAMVAIVVGALLAVFITVISNSLAPYDEPFAQVLLYNIIIGAVANLIIMSIVEATRFYRQHQQEKRQREMLERENVELRYDILKKQLDPHFLFNSLNVLSSLVRTDKMRAQNFIDEFASVYRYALDVIDKPMVTVKEELDFAESYLYLQKIRFDNAVNIHVNADEAYLSWLIPPLAVQTVLENAFKHNIASSTKPLSVHLYTKDKALFVVNSRQPRKKQSPGKGIGFANLKSRYGLISTVTPEVMMTDENYVIKLPIFQAE